MTEAAVVWSVAGRLTVSAISASGEVVIGRTGDVGVRVEHPTVSRRQAVIIPEGSRFLIENAGKTNPTKLAGKVPVERAPLMDGDAIQMGGIHLQFHHLAARDAISGPICSTCGRENSAKQHDCWFCGTSLVNALSQDRKRRRVAGRLASDSGPAHDLLAGQSAAVAADGSVDIGDAPSLPDGGLVLRASDEGLKLQVSDGCLVVVNGEPASNGQVLATGDLLEAANSAWVVIAR